MFYVFYIWILTITM